jgi:hypothetical protein
MVGKGVRLLRSFEPSDPSSRGCPDPSTSSVLSMYSSTLGTEASPCSSTSSKVFSQIHEYLGWRHRYGGTLPGIDL